MKKKIYEKEYIVKEGQEDWRVWTRATDYLYKLMHPKRRSTFKERRIKKQITVKIEIYEGKNKSKRARLNKSQ